MKQIRILGLIMLATFALSAIVVTAAQASGPFYKLNGIRLLEKEKEEITATAQKMFIFNAPGLAGFTIVCKKLKFKAGAEIIGSSGANSSTTKETPELEECVLGGGGEKCRIKKETIKFEPGKNTLAYPKKVPALGDAELVLFQPEKKGGALFGIEFEPEPGGKCTFEGVLFIEGSLAWEAQNGKKEPFKLKEKVAETEIVLVHSPTKAVAEACAENAGEVTCIKPKLTFLAKIASLEGAAGLTLKSKSIWGVFSE
jgi:hypothetical protein